NPSTASLMPAATKRKKATRISPAVIAQTTTGTSKMRARLTRLGMLKLCTGLATDAPVAGRRAWPCARQYSRAEPIAQLPIPEYRGAPLRRGSTVADEGSGNRRFADRPECGQRESRKSDERMAKKRVAVLISGRGSNLLALIEAAKQRSYPAEISLVLSNRAQ